MASVYCHEVRAHGHEVLVRDLYGMQFDPVLKSIERSGTGHLTMPDVVDELELLGRTDVFVLIYPIWFGGPPAMLKGYMDRVLGTGAMPAALECNDATGILHGKKMISFTSSATDARWLSDIGQLDALITGLDRYIDHGFGMQPSEHVHFGAVTNGIGQADVERYLETVRKTARAVCRSIDGSAAVEALAPSKLPTAAHQRL